MRPLFILKATFSVGNSMGFNLVRDIVPFGKKRKEGLALFRKVQTALLWVPAFVQTLLILHASFVDKVINIQYR